MSDETLGEMIARLQAEIDGLPPVARWVMNRRLGKLRRNLAARRSQAIKRWLRMDLP